MRTLVVDTATEACSVALFEDGSLLAGDWRMLGRGHAESLVPMVAALPGRGRADRIAVSLGPGSFTGLRVGLAAARALGLAWGVPVLGYPTLALVAAMARQDAGAVPVCVVMSGGHGEWFVGAFDAAGASQHPALSLAPADAVGTCTSEIAAGSQAEAFIARRQSGHALPLWPDARCFPLLGDAALEADPQLIYGRPPDAKVSSP
jgi:tRNA threonylcarbamoyl adenosine modification protein YeaZ